MTAILPRMLLHLMPRPHTLRIMPRTTIDLDATVLARLRERARREGKSMGQTGSELLARSLEESEAEPGTSPFEWPTSRMGEFLVDLEDPEAVRRAMGEAPI